MKIKHFLLVFFFAVVFSCSKDENNSIQNDSTFELNDLYSGQDIITNFFIRVMSEDGVPVSGVKVEIEGEQLITDQFGIAQFIDISVDADRTHIKASLNGYFDAYRNLNPSEGTNYVNFNLRQRTIYGTFNTSNGALIAYEGVEINFSPGSLEKANGDSFDGNVNVFSVYLDPTSADLGPAMPGDFIGTDGNGVSVLETYGMIAVELESDAGEILNLGEGQEATLAFPVPPSLLANAPLSIPLWNYNTTDNIWEKEGEALLQGNSYVGSVSHFTWWNCDFSSDLIHIEFELVHGVALLPSGNLNFAMSLNGFTATGTTNSAGRFEGYIPKNKSLTFKIYDPCGSLLHSQIIGPFNVDTDIGTISLPAVDVGYPFIGVAVDCNGDPVTTGYAILKDAGSLAQQITPVNPDGTFTFSVGCTSTIANYELLILDLGNNFITEDLAISYDSSDINDIGTVIVCDEQVNEYFIISLGGIEYNVFEQYIFNNSGNCITIGANGSAVADTTSNFTMKFENNGSIGLINECSLGNAGSFYGKIDGLNFYVDFVIISGYIIEYPNSIGEYFTGSFSAAHTTSNIGNIPGGTATGSFSILND